MIHCLNALCPCFGAGHGRDYQHQSEDYEQREKNPVPFVTVVPFATHTPLFVMCISRTVAEGIPIATITTCPRCSTGGESWT